MSAALQINNRLIGFGHPAYIIAEISANHNRDFEEAVRIIKAAKKAGADAIKLQTYTADTLTIDSDTEWFRIGKGTIWEGQTLHALYKHAYTPWEWQPKLKKLADELGLDCFSTPFDRTAVDFLEKMDVPAHKIASFEIVDIGLIQDVARTGKPVIMSTGMASIAEIDEAVRAFRDAGGSQLALLKCTSAYPARPDDAHLRTIPHLSAAFHVPVGLSDHTLGLAVPVAAVTLGACIVEKHLTMSRDHPGPDSSFSLEPDEFAAMVEAVRTAEKALGQANYETTPQELPSRAFRRSLFVVQDVAAGELFTPANVRSIRPGHGLHTRFLPEVIGKRAKTAVLRGTPLSWDLIA